jgi:RNA polymerase sigma factor (TIGR02999 family)
MYEQLRGLAHHRLANDPQASINTTALVHEAYLRLAGSHVLNIKDRNHFLGLASRVMRHVLVDHARARKAAKREPGPAPVAQDAVQMFADDDALSVLQLDAALKQLEAVDERRCRILEQRYFGGMTLEETSDALGVSVATVKRELRSARAWLTLALSGEAE